MNEESIYRTGINRSTSVCARAVRSLDPTTTPPPHGLYGDLQGAGAPSWRECGHAGLEEVFDHIRTFVVPTTRLVVLRICTKDAQRRVLVVVGWKV